MATPMIAFAVALYIAVVSSWDTELNGPFTYNCYGGQVLKHVESMYINIKKDRLWEFSCVSTGANASNSYACRWTDYINIWNEPISFSCPLAQAIAGVHSYYSYRHGDRRFMFKCCKHQGFKTSSCALTTYAKSDGDPLTLYVSEGSIFAGWNSVYAKGDRLHSFLLCNYGS